MGSQVLGDTLITVWKAPMTLDSWLLLVGRASALAKRFPEGILRFDVILPDSHPPDAKLRSKIQSDIREFGSRLRLLVVVPWATLSG